MLFFIYNIYMTMRNGRLEPARAKA